MTHEEIVTGIAVAPDGKVTDVTALNNSEAVTNAAYKALGQATPIAVYGQVFEFPVVFLMDLHAKTNQAPPNDYATSVLTDAVFDFGTNERALGTVVMFGTDEHRRSFVDLHSDVIEHVRSLSGAQPNRP